MYMKKTILSVLLVISITIVYAQKNFLPGWVALNKTDTLKGLVDYRNWEKNPRAIDFKLGLDGKTETYAILQLEAFGIDGYDQYIRAVVVKDMLPVNINNLER